MKRFYLLIALIVALFIFFLPTLRNRFFSSTPKSKPQVITQINRSFDFPAKDKNGREVATLKFTLVQAEKVDQIARQNSPVKAPANQEFLIIALEVTNDSKETLSLSSAQLIRLLDGEKKFAPDFHNDAIEIFPLSVKRDEVAFLVPLNQKTFKLQIGEVVGDKQEIEINF